MKKTSKENTTKITEEQMDTPTMDSQIIAGFDTYAEEGLISADAAARVLATLWDKHLDFTDFDCRIPSNALDWQRFKGGTAQLVAERGGVDPILKRMFDTVAGEPDALFVTLQQLADCVVNSGVDLGDQRLGALGRRLGKGVPDDRLTPNEFITLCATNIAFLRRLMLSEFVIPNFAELRKDMNTLYDLVAPNRSGANADYIPVLRDADPERWGVSFCSVDGQRHNHGNVNDYFSIQSKSKPISYGISLTELGPVATHSWVGMEPSGRPFNAPDLLGDSRPYNPMVNAGAIITCSLVSSAYEGDSTREVIERLRMTWVRLTGGGSVRLSEETMISEKATADNNFALAYLMKSRRGLPAPLERTLDVYFGACSLELTCADLAVAAATLANGGICPVTGEKIFSSDVVKSILALMASSGMYDYSGEFLYRIGIPAKSGVGGGIMVVVPNVGGFATFSPRLDKYGNSVRGGEFFNRLVTNFSFHVFDNVSGGFNGFKKDPAVGNQHSKRRAGPLMRWAAALGDTRCRALHSTFLKMLAAVGMKEATAEYVRHVQQVYARCMKGFVTANELESVAKELGDDSLASALSQLSEDRNEWNSADVALIFDATLMLLNDRPSREQIRVLKAVAQALGIKEETIEFLMNRLKSVTINDLLVLHDADAPEPVPADPLQMAPPPSPAPELSNSDMIRIVQDTWEVGSRKKDELGKLFYSRLLWTDATAAQLFRNTKMSQQMDRLIQMLNVAFEKVEHLDEIRDSLVELGSRHVGYRVEPQHYASLRDSIIWALAQTLGAERWSLEADRSVGWAIDQVAAVMLEAASQEPSAQAR